MSKTVNKTIRLPIKLAERLQAAAEASYSTQNALIVRAILAELERGES